MEKRCKHCGRKIIKDWFKWLRENPETVYVQCPYPDCYGLERIR